MGLDGKPRHKKRYLIRAVTEKYQIADIYNSLVGAYLKRGRQPRKNVPQFYQF